MRTLIALVIAVPVVDLALKRLLRGALQARAISLGPLGSLRIVAAPLWLARSRWRIHGATLWVLWSAAAGVLSIAVFSIPSLQLFAGLMLGGALGNAVESAWRGRVSDYVCLTFWPAFNLADVAITAGAVGLVIELISAMQRAA